jgi:IS5 family transposase
VRESSEKKLSRSDVGSYGEAKLLEWAKAEERRAMLAPKDLQKDFFDDYVYGKLIPQGHEIQAIALGVDFSFVEEEVADLYSEDTGRPAYPAEVLFKMLFLEYYANLSDVEVAKQCRYNLLYRSFVGLGINEPTPDDTTLVVFRRRLGQERFERLFNRVVEQCCERGLLEGRLKIVDATHVIANIAVPNTINLLRQARRAVVSAIEKETQTHQPDLRQRYQTEEAVHREPTAEILAQVTALSRELVQQVKGHYGERVASKVALLEKILDPQPKEKVVSVTDPDARFGHKTPSKTFVGYKVHAIEDDSEIVTTVEVLSGNENEGSKLGSLLDKERQKGIAPVEIAADALYDSLQNRRHLEAQGMVGYIPSRKPNKRAAAFIYEPEDDSLVCPAGHHSVGQTRQERGALYTFSPRHCRPCLKREKCPPLNHGRVVISVSQNHKYALQMPANAGCVNLLGESSPRNLLVLTRRPPSRCYYTAASLT